MNSRCVVWDGGGDRIRIQELQCIVNQEPPDLGLCVNLTILIAEHGLGNLDGGCVRARDLELGVEHLPPVLTG